MSQNLFHHMGQLFLGLIIPKVIRSHGVIVLVLLAAGCGGPAGTRLVGGQLTSLDDEAAAIRFGLAVSPQTSPISFRYRGGQRCRYMITNVSSRGVTSRREQRITTRQVGNRVQVVLENVAGGAAPGTYLIGLNGQVLDYNERAGRDTIENQRQRMEEARREQIRQFGRLDGLQIPFSFSQLFPYFREDLLYSSRTSVSVEDLEGKPFLDGVFTGVARYQGRDVLVIDFTMRDPSNYFVIMGRDVTPRALAAFTLLDARTTMPVVSAFGAGGRWRLVQTSCSR